MKRLSQKTDWGAVGYIRDYIISRKRHPLQMIKIGHITMQRKGDDGGRDTAIMLQFKFNPAVLFT